MSNSESRMALLLAPTGRRKELAQLLRQPKFQISSVYDIDSKLCESLRVPHVLQAVSIRTRNELQEDWRNVLRSIAGAIAMTLGRDQLYILLGHALGSSTKDSVVYHLKSKGICIEDAATRPIDFMKGFYGIFGAGTRVIEAHFVDEIRRALGITSLASSLSDVIEMVKYPGNYVR